MPLTAVPNPLEVAARARPDTIALSFNDVAWTFAELNAAAAAACTGLPNIPAGGRIGILSANRPGFAITVHAATRAAIPVVPLNWRLAAAEVAWQAEQAGLALLLADELNWAAAEAIAASVRIPLQSIERLERLPLPASVAPAPPLPLDQDAAIIFTSGTSGQPKGARITYGNFWYGAVASMLHLGHDPEDVWLAVLPLFHIGGLAILFRAAVGGAKVVLQGRFEPHSALQAMDDGATLISLVPTMLQGLIDARGPSPWPLPPRCILLGGAPAPMALIEACLARGIPAAPTYGLTESTAQVATLPPRELRRKPGSSGLPLPLTRVRIVDDGRILDPGKMGEIAFAGPTRFAGYLGERDQRSDDGEGWFRTGDAGYLDEDGYLYLVDRRDDLIVSGGENIYPAEIEQVLLQHPNVRDAGVIGIPDLRWGARPVAFVVWEGDAEGAQAALVAHSRAHIATFKAPNRIVLLPELPRTASGKLLRRVLRDMAIGNIPP